MAVLGFLLMDALTVYIILGLKVLTGLRARPMETPEDELPLSDNMHALENMVSQEASESSDHSSRGSLDLLQPPSTAAAPRVRGDGPTCSRVRGDGPTWEFIIANPGYAQTGRATRAEQWALSLTKDFDFYIYSALLCGGFVVYMATNYAMPCHLPLNVLAFFVGLKPSPAVRRFLHPIFTCAGLTIFGIWIFGLMRNDTLQDGLRQYSTGSKYLQFFLVTQNSAAALPGAADILGSVLDASIVSLALPMFSFKKELRIFFWILMVPNLIVATLSFFAYPAICHFIGIEARRSLAMTARSVTLALAVPVVQNIDGDTTLVVVMAILTGILGVLIGFNILRLLRVRDDDYVTKGVSMGANASAIATAHLLSSDPRAAALSSLSFVMFGTTMVVLSAIPPVVAAVQRLAGL